ITVYSDRSFTFITKTPPAPVLLKKAAKVDKGSAVPQRDKVGKVTMAQIEEIAKLKMPDLNSKGDIESAKRMIAGTARSMGLEIIGELPARIASSRQCAPEIHQPSKPRETLRQGPCVACTKEHKHAKAWKKVARSC